MSPDPRTTFDLVFDLQEQRAFGVTRKFQRPETILAGLEALQTHLGEIHDGGNCSRPHSGRSWNWAGVGVAEKV